MKINYRVPETAIKTIKSIRILFFLSLSVLLIQGCDDDDPAEPAPPETSTMMDVDGNVYVTVKIGDQWWMAENLKVTSYRNGDPITQAQTSGNWVNSANGAWCFYGNNVEAPGLLYNYSAVSDPRNIAPDGWRIPTDNDWKLLERHLGMSESESNKTGWRGSDEGEKLKIEENKGWVVYEDVWSTNESGFTALAGSCRLFDGVWGDPGLQHTGFWWTSTQHPDGKVWYRHLDYKNADVFRQRINGKYGMSIRCVKN